MKNLFLAVAAALLLTPAALSAQSTSSRTYFEGERITGVDASSAFNVVLVKSNQTKAVVEVGSDIESYVNITRSSDGIVSIGMRDMGSREWRLFSNRPERERTMRLTLYLPSLNTIRLSGATDITSNDTFTGENVDIRLSGASDIKGDLSISSERVKLQCSGASDASLILPATRDLVVVASGACDVDIAADGLTYSKLGASGASDITIKGDGEGGDWTASGASGIKGEDFVARELTVSASGASSARVNVTGTLTTRTSGASSIRYAGKPASINNQTDDVRPL